MLIDTHSHLNFSAFDKDRDKVIENCLKNDVWVINVGTNFETSKKAVEIAEKYERGIYPHTTKNFDVGVYAAIGLHPINIKQIQNAKMTLRGVAKSDNKIQNGNVKCKNPEDILEDDFNYQKYKNLADSKKVVAIGEIGLDYYYKPKTKKKLGIFKEKQKIVLCQQLKLAKELNLPVIFHCRFAIDDLLEILRFQVSGFKFQGVIHCFTGNWQQAKRFIEMGFYLGFNGIIFKMNLEEVIKETPLDKILVETDCPYLTPPISVNQCTFTPLDNFVSNGASQCQSVSAIRNNPLGVGFIAQKIAEMKNLSFEEIAEITMRNSHRLFSQME